MNLRKTSKTIGAVECGSSIGTSFVISHLDPDRHEEESKFTGPLILRDFLIIEYE